MKNNTRGFTLIEIVMVLVLLGILSAVALPKYYDLKSQAEKQTAKAVAAEYQARLNASFAENLLGNNNCTTSRGNAIEEADKLFSEAADVAVNKFTMVKDPETVADTDSKFTLKLSKDGKGLADVVIALPTCYNPVK
ncbi:type II secretion system protein [Sutterella sp.]|uniref:type II secretion system protein n=1 Tax=Sutterella sp. TaxID=1981025 RepID=UPI003FD73AB2